ncbi:heme/copper-type cytochrome/quinol oxidase subunit 3 [Paraburkholderia sp. UCT70]
MTQSALLVHHGRSSVDHGPTPTVFGFWLYLMTDCVLFASLFAVFAVMAHQFAGGWCVRTGPVRHPGCRT